MSTSEGQPCFHLLLVQLGLGLLHFRFDFLFDRPRMLDRVKPRRLNADGTVRQVQQANAILLQRLLWVGAQVLLDLRTRDFVKLSSMGSATYRKNIVVGDAILAIGGALLVTRSLDKQLGVLQALSFPTLGCSK